MKKKNLILIATVFLLVFVFSSTVVAADNIAIENDTTVNKKHDKIFKVNENEKLIFEKSEITDKEKLIKRAKKGINDNTTGKVDLKVKIKKNGKSYTKNIDKIKKYYTVQKLKTKKNMKTGEKITLYRQDNFYHIPKSLFKNNKNEKKVVAMSGPSILEFEGLNSNKLALLSDPDQGEDGSISVRATNTIYYQEAEFKNSFGIVVTVYRFPEVQAKWELLDQNMEWSEAQVGFYQQGTAFTSSGDPISGGKTFGTWEDRPSGGVPVDGETYSIYPVNYYDNNAWGVWSSDYQQRLGQQRIHIERKDSSTEWDFWFQNYRV